MISVVVPAHNEERYLGGCLDSVAEAAKRVSSPVETVVVLNRCVDRTEEIAVSRGARVVREDARNLARIRNAGAAAARGEILVTIDADSRMSANMLVHVVRLLETGKFIGGGTLIIPERWSLGICCSLLPLVPYALWYRVSAGLFWCYKKDFDAIGGFDEDFISVEDVDFAERLRAYGRRVGKRYGTIWRGWITTSCRKFDHFGDWYFFRNPSVVRRLFTGRDRAAADRFYYEVGRHEGEEKA